MLMEVISAAKDSVWTCHKHYAELSTLCVHEGIHTCKPQAEPTQNVDKSTQMAAMIDPYLAPHVVPVLFLLS